MAAPAFGAMGTRLAGGTSGTAAVGVPAGVTAGQLVFVFLYLEANRTVTAPAGFTLLGGANQATGNHWSYVFWKRATGADAGTYSFTFTSTFREAVALRVSGAAAAGDPIDAFTKAGRSTSGTVTPAVSVTTTGPDRLLIWFGSDFSTGSWTPPAGYTERLDDGTEIAVATATQAAAGSTGSVTGTSTGNNQQTAWLVAVLPDSADVDAAVSAARTTTAAVTAARSDAAAVTAATGPAPVVTGLRSDAAAVSASSGPARTVTGQRVDVAQVSAIRTATAAVTAASSTAAVSAASGPSCTVTATVSSPGQVSASTGRAATVTAARTDVAAVTATRTAVATVTPVQPTASVSATTGRAATVTGQRVDVAALTATRARAGTVTGLRTDIGQVSGLSGPAAAVAAGAISALGATGAALNPSVWAVDRVTLQITGQLPAWTRLQLSPVENSPGSCELRYAAGSPGFAALFSGVTASPQRDQEIEVWLDGTRASRTRWLLQQKTGDDVALGQVWTFTGHGLAQLLDEIVVGPQATESRELVFTAATYGTVLITALQQAKARSAAILAGLTWDFTTTHDSAGQPWAQTISDLRFAPDDTLLAVAQAGVEFVIGEFEVSADRVLRAFNSGSRGVDRSTGSTPLRLQAGVNLDEAARRESSRAGDAATAALGKGAEGVYEWAVDATAQAQRGRRVEVPVDAGQLTTAGAVLATTTSRLAALKVGVAERTHGLVFGPGFPIPTVDFDVSDWALSVTGNAATRQRLTQWTATFERGRPPSGTARTNTLIEDQLSRLTRRLNAVQRGGAVVGTSVSTDPDTKAPAQVTGVTVDSSAHQDGADTVAVLHVDWAEVITNVDGTAADDIAGYRVEHAYAAAPDGWQLAADVPATIADVGGLTAGVEVLVRVCAYDRTGNAGAWSVPVTVLTEVDDIAPPAPSTPVVTTRVSILAADWDGLGSAGEPMPPDLDHVEVHVSAASGFTPSAATYYDRLPPGGGVMPITGRPYGATTFVRLVAVDRTTPTPNRSAPSAQGSATPQKLVTIDFGPESVDRASIKLAAIGNAQIDVLAVNAANIGSVNAGTIVSGTVSALLTLSGIIRTDVSPNRRMEITSNGWQSYDASNVLWAELNLATRTMLVTGTYLSGSSGERIRLDPDGSARWYGPTGTDYASIANDGGILRMRSRADGSGRRSFVEFGTGGVTMSYGAEFGTRFSRADFGVTFGVIAAPVLGHRILNQFTPTDGTANRYFLLAADAGGDIGPAIWHFYDRSGDESLVARGIAHGAGLMFNGGYTNCLGSSDGVYGGLTADGFTTPSSGLMKTAPGEITRELGTTARRVLGDVDSQAWRYLHDLVERPPTTGQFMTRIDPDGTEVQVPVPWAYEQPVAPLHFGPIAEDLAAVSPHLVRRDPQGRLLVDQRDLVGLLWAALRDVDRDHTARLDRLEGLRPPGPIIDGELA